MSSPSPPENLAPEISALLGRVRWRIRAYVVMYGLALAAVWLGLTFWAFLGIDYFLVVVGSNEMPRAVRGVLLGVTALVLGGILYQFVLRRLAVRLSNQSMAVLVERRFGNFHDSLLTAVEVAERPTEAAVFNPEMVRHTAGEARSLSGEVQPARLFNWAPLARALGLAVALVVSVVAFFLIDRESFTLWGSRLYALSDTPWPRKTQIEVVSVSVSRGNADQEPHTALFVERVVKVARGSNVTLAVRADGRRFVPEVCSILYRTDDGGTGRPHMQRQGKVRDDQFQYYTFADAPLSKIFSSIDFDVIGFDHRLRDYRIEVVDSPLVVQASVAYVPPKYLFDERSGVAAPPPKPVMPGLLLPTGAQVTLILECNKRLAAVQVADAEKLARLELPARLVGERVEVELGTLERNLALDIDLVDADGVRSERPFRVALTAAPDKPPEIDVALKGIGRLVTTAARVPVVGTLRDDYGVDLSPENAERAWFEIKRGEAVRTFPFTLEKPGELQAALDFDSRAPVSSGDFKLLVGDKITLAVKAEDRCDLAGGPNVGASGTVQLEVVTPDELLADVAARVLEMRRLLEHAVDETSASRDSLLRLRTGETESAPAPEPAAVSGTAGANPAAPGETPAPAAPAAQAAEAPAVPETQRFTLRLLRVQHCRQQGQKSQGEILGAAGAFDDLAAELENNRVDAQDRKEKLREAIAAPLRKIGGEAFPKLEQALAQVEAGLGDAAASPQQVEAAIGNCQEILRDLETVLTELRELEEYNELVKIMRDLIRDQSGVITDTKRQRDEDLLKGIDVP